MVVKVSIMMPAYNTENYPRLFSTGNYDYLEIAILSKTQLWLYKRNDG